MNRVVFEGKTEDGLNIIIGYPKRSGLLGMHNFINDLSAERTFVRNQGIQISLDEEKDFLGKQLKSTADNKSVQLLAICNNKLVGISGIEMRDRSQKHIGNFGISVTKGYQDKGIGSKLIDTVLKEAT